ncbi:MAG: SDR family oxidoreductase [Burkholderiaceae bacterium]|nr:SDR family oxidoreductase [Burkholderiaceae bacterium]
MNKHIPQSSPGVGASFRLDGKIALITGASRGIGEAIARALAGQGAHVIISSRKVESCERVADSIRRTGGQASVLACHIGDVDQLSAAFDKIRMSHGKLNVLVNNAAANPYFGPALDTPIEAFQKTVDINIRGYFFSIANAVRMMPRGGSVINIASISGVVPGPQQGLYSITKAAVISMTKVFSAECGAAGIRVNALLPGITDTRFAAALVHDSDMLSKYLPRIPLGRVAQPNELAGAAIYLASDASSYTTGACLPVDGGYLTT